MSVDLTPSVTELADLQARLTAAEARGDRAEDAEYRWHREAMSWQHAYQAARGKLATQAAEITRLRGRLAVCRCRAPLEGR